LSPSNEALTPLKRKDDAPLFDEPWQAQALAMADMLVRSGTITATDWASTLGAQLRQRAPAEPADDANAYYGAVLAALQELLYRNGTVDPGQVASLQEQWERAYLNTPHGSPVELSAAEKY
jgi:nitrile hydratase accessory protein